MTRKRLCKLFMSCGLQRNVVQRFMCTLELMRHAGWYVTNEDVLRSMVMINLPTIWLKWLERADVFPVRVDGRLVALSCDDNRAGCVARSVMAAEIQRQLPSVVHANNTRAARATGHENLALQVAINQVTAEWLLQLPDSAKGDERDA